MAFDGAPPRLFHNDYLRTRIVESAIEFQPSLSRGISSRTIAQNHGGLPCQELFVRSRGLCMMIVMTPSGRLKTLRHLAG